MNGISRPMTWPTTRSSGPSTSRAILAVEGRELTTRSGARVGLLLQTRPSWFRDHDSGPPDGRLPRERQLLSWPLRRAGIGLAQLRRGGAAAIDFGESWKKC